MSENEKKPKTKWNKDKYSALKKQLNTRIRQEYIDMDYIDQLDDTEKKHELPDGTMVTEKEWMNYFMREWNNASVPKQSEAHKGKLHRTAKEIKACTDRNNARNNDVYGIAKARNRKSDDSISDIEERREITSNYVEDALIDILDETQKLSNTTDDTSNDTE